MKRYITSSGSFSTMSLLLQCLVTEKNYTFHIGLSRTPRNIFPIDFQSKLDEYCIFLCNFFFILRNCFFLFRPNMLLFKMFLPQTPTPHVVFNWYSLVDNITIWIKLVLSLPKKPCKLVIKRLKNRNLFGSYQRKKTISAKSIWQTSNQNKCSGTVFNTKIENHN